MVTALQGAVHDVRTAVQLATALAMLQGTIDLHFVCAPVRDALSHHGTVL